MAAINSLVPVMRAVLHLVGYNTVTIILVPVRRGHFVPKLVMWAILGII